ncbi:C4-dicarboxylate ABC transporter permease [Clostridiaceae bacterium]|nr:C4-dicarboxylate ABC transporter permease [Lachnospiraceae bacterium]NBH19697.1 C4-dicarboxylate ABC transporter permease [Clostridiaceae bacterium]
MLSTLFSVIIEVFQPFNLLVVFVGSFVGIFVGAMPGLSSIMGLSLMLPLTLKFTGNTGILMLLGVFCGAIYGGSITAILIKTPGTANSAATVLDGYPLTQKGKAAQALGVSTLASAFGGIFSAVMLLWTAPLLSKVALSFTSPEYFSLAIFGLSMVTSLSSKNVTKGLISALIGLMLATVGMDALTGVKRFTFHTSYLMGGIAMVPVLIGLYAFSQGLANTEQKMEDGEHTKEKIRRTFPEWTVIRKVMPTLLRSSLIGTMVGAIPGTGGDIASWLAYNEARRWDKHPEEFGTGRLEGVAAPEAANNAVSGGALIPLLTLGIPGDAGTAVMLGAMMMQGIVPGPLLFTSEAGKVYTIIVGLFVANIFMGFLGFMGIRLFSKIGDISNKYLTPIVFVFCIVGTFALNNSIYDVYLMMLVGIVAFFLMKLEFPMPPVILGLILGNTLEKNLQRSLMVSKGSFTIFFTRPISMGLLIIAFLSIFLPLIMRIVKTKVKSPAAG